MASLGIHNGGGGVGGAGATNSSNRRGTITKIRSPIASLNVTSAMTGNRKCHVMPISMSASRANIDLVEPKRRQEQRVWNENVIDKWMKDSVVEIVKNLRETPLLVHVYSDNGNGDSTRLTTEKAVPEDWPLVKSKWEDGTTPLPEGVIFVEQLKEEDAEEESDAAVGFGRESETTRAWGIVVQAKGEYRGPACYLLKTSRGGSGSGLGLCCTHFCLVKVKSFRETAEAQFKNCWLLNGLRSISAHD